jgi:hypothetical protein
MRVAYANRVEKSVIGLARAVDVRDVEIALRPEGRVIGLARAVDVRDPTAKCLFHGGVAVMGLARAADVWDVRTS